MALLSLQQVSLAFGHVPLLDHVDFVIEPGERIALIGRNGTGKSSLLKVVLGSILPDSGEVQRQNGITLADVPQEPVFGEAQTIFQAVAQGVGPVWDLLAQYEAMAQDPAHDADALHAIQQAIDDQDGWMATSRIEQALSRLSLEGSVLLSDLSGGQRKRVALARAMVAGPTILVLDEPTNHLDVESIQWLEDTLKSFAGSVLLVTHDRFFLNNVATRVIELDRGNLRSYPGNFAAYEARKEYELNAERLEQARFDKMLSQEEIWIRKGVQARRTRSVGRVERLMQMRKERAARREQTGRVNFAVDSGAASGKLVAELKNVSKSWGGKPIITDFSAVLLRGDKIGLIGPNGAGKTTLLKLILGELAPDAGSVRLGTQIQVAYFDQLRAQLDEERTVIDSITPGSDWIEIGGQRKHVMSYLQDFLFAPERARSPVKSLSGGERNRLLLARLFARPANVLVLDEPTNDLDIDTLELLEEMLQSYEGTVFLVSHDRTFLDNVVTETIAWEGPGQWREYVGGYQDWLRQRGPATASNAAPAVKNLSVTLQMQPDPKTAVKKPTKLSYKEQRELDELPAKLAALEAEQAAVVAKLNDPTFYQSSSDELRKVTDRAAELDLLLTELITRWDALEAKAS
jgi:ATP-binding cassette subfamily F protein uup